MIGCSYPMWRWYSPYVFGVEIYLSLRWGHQIISKAAFVRTPVFGLPKMNLLPNVKMIFSRCFWVCNLPLTTVRTCNYFHGCICLHMPVFGLPKMNLLGLTVNVFWNTSDLIFCSLVFERFGLSMDQCLIIFYSYHGLALFLHRKDMWAARRDSSPGMYPTGQRALCILQKIRQLQWFLLGFCWFFIKKCLRVLVSEYERGSYVR